jgi:hypothetical protein
MDNDMLFALRTYYQDYYQDEKDIIEMLKTNLLDKGVESDEVNNVLKNFYANFGIDIDLSIFEEINALPTQNELLNQLNNTESILFNFVNNLNQNNENSDSDSDLESEESGVILTEPLINENSDSDSDLEPEESGVILPAPLINDISNNQYNLFSNNTNQTNSITNLVNLLTTVMNLPLMQENNDVVCTLDEEDKEKLKKYKLKTEIVIQCNICLDNMNNDDEVMELPCKHFYHHNCINEYLEKYNYKCPCCRNEVGKPKYNI